ALSYTQLKATERQVQADSNAVLTAERTLLLWKMTPAEIEAVKKEANIIHDQQLVRNADAEAKRWGRVEIRVPVFDPLHPERELTVVEKNTNLNSMVDPIATSPPFFPLPDLT